MESINKYPEVTFSNDNGKISYSVKYAKQRQIRGWDDTELWNLDTTIAKFIIPRLKRFKKIKRGHPEELSEEEWNEILDKMIKAFETTLYVDYFISDNTEEFEEGIELFKKYFKSLWL